MPRGRDDRVYERGSDRSGERRRDWDRDRSGHERSRERGGGGRDRDRTREVSREQDGGRDRDRTQDASREQDGGKDRDRKRDVSREQDAAGRGRHNRRDRDSRYQGGASAISPVHSQHLRSQSPPRKTHRGHESPSQEDSRLPHSSHHDLTKSTAAAAASAPPPNEVSGEIYLFFCLWNSHHQHHLLLSWLVLPPLDWRITCCFEILAVLWLIVGIASCMHLSLELVQVHVGSCHCPWILSVVIWNSSVLQCTFCLGFVSRFCDFSNLSARFQTARSIGRRSFDLLWVQNLRSFLSPLSLEVHKMYILRNGKDCCMYMFGVVWWWRRNCTFFWLFCGLFTMCSRWDMEQALRKGVHKTCVENASKCHTANCSSFSGWTVLI